MTTRITTQNITDATITTTDIASSVPLALNWQSVKTSNFTAVAGEAYPINTTSGVVTITLPSSPSVGDTVQFLDYAGTFATNKVTIGRGGSNIQGSTSDGAVSTNRQTVTLVYVDATKGWLPANDGAADQYGAEFISATGGTTSSSGNDRIHTFNSTGNFVVNTLGNSIGSNTVEYLVIAGGGGAGGPQSNNVAGGAGAGGYRTNHTNCAPHPGSAGVSVSASTYPVVIGAGGAGGSSHNPPSPNQVGTDGSVSSALGFSSAGGGGGGGGSPNSNPSIYVGRNGGSGGGGGGGHSQSPSKGTGNTPPVSPSQGNPGGDGGNHPAAPGGDQKAAGGGGAGAAGTAAIEPNNSGPGGVGLASDISGASTFRAGGGGGGKTPSHPANAAGGNGGGGTAPSGAGTTNTGGGGAAGVEGATGGAGGSGVVIIRYKYQ